jgi:two-component system cell cycle response regulator
LVQVAATIRATVRDADAVARIGGDEFVVVFGGGSKVVPATVAERLRRAIEKTAHGQLPAGAEPVTASIGYTVSPAPHHETTPELLLREADTAMYDAKRAGKNATVGYDRGAVTADMAATAVANAPTAD